jgi:ATPase subunit of ABC transporter with duplicated ATPase domains
LQYGFVVSHRAKDLYVLAQLRNVSLSFPDKKVLEDAFLTVYPGDRISLVGENGAGKTSLFRILKGRLKPDAGQVSFTRGVSIGYLEQDLTAVDEDPKRTCMNAAYVVASHDRYFVERLATGTLSLGRT